MKQLSILTVILLMSVSCGNQGSDRLAETGTSENLTPVKYEVAIEGMTCTGCEETIKAGVMKLDGVESIEANHTEGKATVVFYKEKTDTTAIKESIKKSGYKVRGFMTGSDD